MTDLPSPITAYVDANARLDVEGMLAAFAPDAVVADEGHRRTGHAEIRRWIEVATVGSSAVFSPDRWRREDETFVVEGPTTGDFPGSPRRFIFRFGVAGNAISTLEIV